MRLVGDLFLLQVALGDVLAGKHQVRCLSLLVVHRHQAEAFPVFASVGTLVAPLDLPWPIAAHRDAYRFIGVAAAEGVGDRAANDVSGGQAGDPAIRGIDELDAPSGIGDQQSNRALFDGL